MNGPGKLVRGGVSGAREKTGRRTAAGRLCAEASQEQEKRRAGARHREGCARRRLRSKKKDGLAHGRGKAVRGGVPVARKKTGRRTAPDRLCAEASHEQEKRRGDAQRRIGCARRRPKSKRKDGLAHNARPGNQRCLSPRAESTCHPAAYGVTLRSGTTTRIRVPSCVRDRISKWPPCLSTIHLAMESPSPVPCSDRVSSER